LPSLEERTLQSKASYKVGGASPQQLKTLNIKHTPFKGGKPPLKGNTQGMKGRGAGRKGAPLNKGTEIMRRGDIIAKNKIGQLVRISDGKILRQVKIQEAHVNLKYGAIVLTKKTPKYKKKNK